MKEHPILFSTPMIQAIQEGRKSQTRRIIKPQPEIYKADGKQMLRYTSKKSFIQMDMESINEPFVGIEHPAYKVVDTLWVRETFAEFLGIEPRIEYVYRADKTFDTPAKEHLVGNKWKPSIFMPEAACRIFLEITNIRVERLQDISEEDAIAEGVLLYHRGTQYLNYLDEKAHLTQFIYNCYTAKESYKTLWQLINGRESYFNNPWVWCITFKKIKQL